MGFNVVTLEPDTFANTALEKGLQIVGPIRGYYYCGERTPQGFTLFKSAKAKRYWWSYRQVCTQDAPGGGSLVVTVKPASGQAFIPYGGYIVASGNRAVQVSLENADGTTIGYYSAVGAVAGAIGTIAGTAGAATTSGVAQELHRKAVAYPNFIEGQVASAAQTETATLVIYGELVGSADAPAVSWADSGGTPNVAAAAEDTVTPVVVEVDA
jgi:hypothetical protein